MPSRRAERRHLSARALAALGRAGVPLTEGMMLANGHRVVEVDAGGAVRVGDVRADHVPMLVFVAGQWHWVQDDRADPRAVPDPGDRGTWLLCLDELGRRLGVDTRSGALWQPVEGGWSLNGRRVAVQASDDLEALALALESTARPEHGAAHAG